MDLLQRLRIFVAVAERGSFARASETLSLARPRVTGAVAALTVIALFPRPSATGAIILAAIGVSPRLAAIGIGASICATSKCPSADRSRILAHDVSRVSLSAMPSSSARPSSCASTASTSPGLSCLSSVS